MVREGPSGGSHEVDVLATKRDAHQHFLPGTSAAAATEFAALIDAASR